MKWLELICADIGLTWCASSWESSCCKDKHLLVKLKSFLMQFWVSVFVIYQPDSNVTFSHQDTWSEACESAPGRFCCSPWPAAVQSTAMFVPVPEGGAAHVLTSALQALCELCTTSFLFCHPTRSLKIAEKRSQGLMHYWYIQCQWCMRWGAAANFLHVAGAESIKPLVIYMRRYCYYFSHGHRDTLWEPNVAACLLTWWLLQLC